MSYELLFLLVPSLGLDAKGWLICCRLAYSFCQLIIQLVQIGVGILEILLLDLV
jgi:hypothetical protein